MGRTIYARQFLGAKNRINSSTGEQKGITQTIYTDSEPPSRLPNSLIPSAKLRSANLTVFTSWCEAVGDRTPASGTPSGRSNHYTTRGRADRPYTGMCLCYNHYVVYKRESCNFSLTILETNSRVNGEYCSVNNFFFIFCFCIVNTTIMFMPGIIRLKHMS